jgi:hypothetical protein
MVRYVPYTLCTTYPMYDKILLLFFFSSRNYTEKKSNIKATHAKVTFIKVAYASYARGARRLPLSNSPLMPASRWVKHHHRHTLLHPVT